MLPDNLRAREFRKILLIKLSAVGDVIHTIPVLNKLRRRYPSAQIDWLVKPAMADLIRPHPAVNTVLLFEPTDKSSPMAWSGLGWAKLAAQIRSRRYDLVIDLQGQLRSALFAIASGAPVRVGFDRPRRETWQAPQRQRPQEAYRHCWRGAREGAWLAYTHPIRVPTLDMPAVDRHLQVGAMLGLDNDPPDFSFAIPPAASLAVDRLLDGYGIAAPPAPLLVMAPGTIWETKRWTVEGFAEVARHFMRRGWPVVLAGSRGEKAICEAVAQASPGSINLAGQTSLTELAALLRRSTICLTNDSGPMHLAVALGRPVVSVFGPTDVLWAGPYHREDAVLAAGLACSPCYLRLLSRCPHDHACMKAVSAAAVIALMEKNLPVRNDLSPAGLTMAG